MVTAVVGGMNSNCHCGGEGNVRAKVGSDVGYTGGCGSGNGKNWGNKYGRRCRQIQVTGRI